jgi:hypothetical protein
VTELHEEKNKIEEEKNKIEEEKNKVEKLNLSFKYFFGILAHDLRGPFNNIL